jgi:hypothetical protein
MPRFRAQRLGLTTSFRSAVAVGQLTLSLPARRCGEAVMLLAKGWRVSKHDDVENKDCRGKPLGPGGKIL